MKWLTAKLSGRRVAGSDAVRESVIINELRQHNNQAFLSLYDECGPSVYRYLLYMSGSQELAEELTQQTFVLVLEEVASGTPFRNFDPTKGSLEGYLIGMCRNLLRSEHRRHSRQAPLPEEANECFSRLEDPLQMLVRYDELERLQRLVAELPEHYRSAIVLCDLQEKSYKEVAHILRCSEGTVASRLNRARGLLKAKFDSKGRSGLMSRSKSEKGGFYERACSLED